MDVVLFVIALVIWVVVALLAMENSASTSAR